MYEGKWLCHVHHPKMMFQQQVAAKRKEEAPQQAARREKRHAARLAFFKAHPTPGLDAPLNLSPDAGRAP